MSRKTKTSQGVISDITRKTRRKFSSAEKIRIVIEGLRGLLSELYSGDANVFNKLLRIVQKRREDLEEFMQ